MGWLVALGLLVLGIVWAAGMVLRDLLHESEGQR